MSQAMFREAEDSFDALLVANGMMKAGARIISITFNGERLRAGAMEKSARFIVCAEVPDDCDFDAIDELIDAERAQKGTG